jgi:hypothetical protein
VRRAVSPFRRLPSADRGSIEHEKRDAVQLHQRTTSTRPRSQPRSQPRMPSGAGIRATSPFTMDHASLDLTAADPWIHDEAAMLNSSKMRFVLWKRKKVG